MTQQDDAPRAPHLMELACVGCGEVITIHPPLLPRGAEKMLPVAVAAVGGVQLAGRNARGDADEPTLFGLLGSEVTALIQPRCAACSAALRAQMPALFVPGSRVSAPRSELAELPAFPADSRPAWAHGK